MQLSLTDRARRPWWLATLLVVVALAMWWQPWRAGRPAPAPVADTAEHLSASDLCTSSSSAPVALAVPVPAPALRLEGVVMAGAGSFATLRHTTDARLLQLRVGDRVDGLTVTEIGLDRVVLASASGSVVVQAEPRAAAAEPAPAAATAAMPAPSLPPLQPLPPLRPPPPLVAAAPVPQLIPIEQLPPAYRGPAPEDEVLGH